MRSALTAFDADAVGAVIERVLAHQEQGRRLGQAVGTEIGPRIDRLLGGVEQQAAAQALGAHHPHGILGHALMGPEIELEALAQGRLVDVADPALPRRAGIGDHDVDTAIGRGDLRSKAARTSAGLVTSQAMARPFTLPAISLARAGSWSSATSSAPSRAKACCRRGTNARAAAGHDDDASRQRLLGLGAELGLLERPVLDIEDVGLGECTA